MGITRKKEHDIEDEERKWNGGKKKEIRSHLKGFIMCGTLDSDVWQGVLSSSGL